MGNPVGIAGQISRHIITREAENKKLGYELKR
jgi:hypothetical protein